MDLADLAVLVEVCPNGQTGAGRERRSNRCVKGQTSKKAQEESDGQTDA